MRPYEQRELAEKASTRRQVQEQRHRRIVELAGKGLTVAQIAARGLGAGQTIRDVLKRHRSEG